MNKYDNYAACEQLLLDSGFRLDIEHELLPGTLYSCLYMKDDKIAVTVHFAPDKNYCDMTLGINYSGENTGWEQVASTFSGKGDRFLFNVDKEAFLRVVCNFPYNEIEKEFRKMEIENTLRVL